jgi:hypothetical protein
MFSIRIQQQKEILLKWIRSCRTAEQLDLLAQIVTEFVVKRFSDKIEFYELELAKAELSDAIIEQRVITAREGQPIRLNTHRPKRIVPLSFMAKSSFTNHENQKRYR